MTFTKSALLIAGFLAFGTAFSAPNPAAFQAEKDARIANIQERLQIVQNHLSCVQAAQDHAAIKVCHMTAEQGNKVLTEKIKAQIAEKKQAPAATPAPATTPAPAEN